jgi:hypothetical protein
MTPKMMVLCALASGPGTRREVRKRLDDRWPAAGFDRNAAYNNLPELVAEGLAVVVETGVWQADICYEIAEAGWSNIRDWIADWPPRPALREPIPAKARLARLGELPGIIGMARALAERCTEESDKAHDKLTARERLREKMQPLDADEEFDAEIMVAQFEDEVRAWQDLSARWLKYANHLEGIYVRFSTKAQQADEGG